MGCCSEIEQFTIVKLKSQLSLRVFLCQMLNQSTSMRQSISCRSYISFASWVYAIQLCYLRDLLELCIKQHHPSSAVRLRKQFQRKQRVNKSNILLCHTNVTACNEYARYRQCHWSSILNNNKIVKGAILALHLLYYLKKYRSQFVVILQVKQIQ